MDTKYARARFLFFRIWSVIGVALILVACGYVLGQLWTSVSIVLFSAFLVFVLRVPVAWMERRGIRRAIGAAISYVLSLIVLALIAFVLLPFLSDQLVGFISSIPEYVAAAEQSWNSFSAQYSHILQDSIIQQFVANLGNALSDWAAASASEMAVYVVNTSTNLLTAALIVFLSFIVGFWVLKDLPRISRELLIILGPRRRVDALVISHSFSHALSGYLKGMGVASLCTGVMSGLAYYFIGLPYPVVLGVLTGLMNFIPMIGPWVAGIIVGLLGLFISPFAALFAIISTILAQQITDNFISPRVMAGAVSLHPSVILVVLVAGGALGGVFGMLCAIPVTAAVKSIFVYYFERATNRRLLSPKGALFKGKTSMHFDVQPDVQLEQEAGSDREAEKQYASSVEEEHGFNKKADEASKHVSPNE